MAQTLARSAQRGAPRVLARGAPRFWWILEGARRGSRDSRGRVARVDTWLSAPIQAQIPQLAWYTDTP